MKFILETSPYEMVTDEQAKRTLAIIGSRNKMEWLESFVRSTHPDGITPEELERLLTRDRVTVYKACGLDYVAL